jgi:MerR family copper efflux transcriptional regulator
MAVTEPTMTIGELAASARVNIETIRYYEREGILPEPPRTASGYRQYSDTDRWRLAFIRRGKSLGFTLKEIAELLGAGEQRSVDEVVNLAEKRLTLVERDIAALTASRDQLRRLIETCATGSGDDCLELAP